jgi:putative copper resistance protein D
MDVDVASVAVRALAFIAGFQAAGAAFFLLLFARDVTTAAPVVTLARRCAIGALALVLVHQLLDAARMSGEFSGVVDPAMQQLALDSATAVANLLRIVGLVLVLVGLRNRSNLVLATQRPNAALAALGGALVCASFLLVGHTSIDPRRWLLAPLLLLHLLVVALWFGSLVPMCIAVRREAQVAAAAVIEHFSRLALRLVPLIFVAGAAMAYALLPDLAALRGDYGRLLLLKVAGFALLMLLAALNKWRLTPALAWGDMTAARALTRSMYLEWWIIAAVLGITATMTSFYSPEA